MAFETVIRKFNPYHDRIGRFTSADGSLSIASKLKFLDGVSDFSQKEIRDIGDTVKNAVEEREGSDPRLEIDMENAVNAINEKTQNGVENRDDPVYQRYKTPGFATTVLIESECLKIIRAAEKEYCLKKLGKDLEFSAENAIVSRTLDFIDGAAWVKENLGTAKGMTGVLGEGENHEKYDFLLGTGTTAATQTDENGTCHLILGETMFGCPGDILKEQNKEGFHPKGLSYAQVGAHEYAHALELSIANDICTKYFGGDDEVRKMMDRGGEVAEVVVSKALERCGSPRSSGLEYPKAVMEVSGYARTSNKEAMAESVCDYYSNGDMAASLSKAVVDVLKTEKDSIAECIVQVPWYRERMKKKDKE